MLTIKQAAEKYGYNTRHLRRLVTSGKIPATRINVRLWLVKDKDVKRYAEAHRRGKRVVVEPGAAGGNTNA